jgi:hypothetical protein
MQLIVIVVQLIVIIVIFGLQCHHIARTAASLYAWLLCCHLQIQPPELNIVVNCRPKIAEYTSWCAVIQTISLWRGLVLFNSAT